MVEESTAASHSLAKEAVSLSDLLRQFKLGGSVTHRTSAPVVRSDPRSAQQAIAKAVKSFPTSGNAALQADEWEEF
jgi:methyl-accepting chemotaxis protein